MWKEAIRLLEIGCPLSFVEGRRRFRLVRTDAGYLFEVYPTPAPWQGGTFDEPQDALLSFLDHVGETGLVRAVGAARYSHLFPLGSSLGWTPIPLQQWRSPMSWRRPQHFLEVRHAV